MPPPSRPPRGLKPRLPSWSSPPNPNIYATSQGELRVPFALHVAASPNQTTTIPATFPQFSRLPLELQHHVLSFCPSATLYQLMHVAHTRTEASKRFWATDDTLYCFSGGWVRQGGWAGKTFYDTEFLARVERVNVWFDDLLPRSWKLQHGDEEMKRIMNGVSINDVVAYDFEYAKRSIEVQIRRFWDTLLRLCPRLTHVLVTANMKDWDSRGRPSDFTERILRPCPAGVGVFVSPRHAGCASAPEVEPQWQPHVWRLIADTADGVAPAARWQQEHVDWIPQFVLPPPKKFQGPVGSFQRSIFKFSRLTMWKAATRSFSIDTIERYHFQSRYTQFGCPLPDCRARFRVPGAYFEHCRLSRHDTYANALKPKDVLHQFRNQTLARLTEQSFWDPYSPDEGLDAPAGEAPQYPAEEALKLKKDQAKKHHVALRANPALITQREHDAHRAFLYQLQHDPLYAMPESAQTGYMSQIYEHRLRQIRSGSAKDRCGPGEFGFCATAGETYPEMY